MEQGRLKESTSDPGEEMTEESFLKDLYFFMKQSDNPIERVPHLGFKQIDLFLMYKTVKELGGYQQVTAQQLWKKVYNILGGNPRSTSAATCTRRHYEKLLLPFECHQTGYGDNIVFRTPRTQKRFHPSSYSEFEHEYRSGKRVDYQHIPVFPPTSPGMFVEHQRQMFGLPLNIPPYISHTGASLPNFLTHPESTQSNLSLNPPDQPTRTPASYLSESSPEVQSCKQSLDLLRHLAKEYKSSAGWEEPLNLSCKQNPLDTLGDTQSSFSPPVSKKPKFLNEASPLYPPRGLNTEEGADQAETTEETSPAGPSPVSSDVIDLTSSSGANPVPRRASPPSFHLFNRRMNYPDAFAMKPDQDQHDWQKGESNLIQNNHQTFDSNGNMEIQIPLRLLQELIRRGLLSSPALSEHKLPSQDSPKTDTPPVPKLHVRSHSSESSPMSKEPEDLSYRNPLRNRSLQDGGMEKPQSFGGTEELKPQSIFGSFQNKNPVKFPFYRDVNPPHPKPASMRKNQDHMRPRYADDTLLSLTMTPKSDKTMKTSSIVPKERSSSPSLMQVTSDHLKLLLANFPYRLEKGPTF
ncbi:AT-rich interactive domain-containing protein 5A [Triplophysa tibetana]|uniref:AT-rich interactive domain-containing protein 5A n=1 Tax=Triplophysa tibetana TaxID=1572043 RepID=A0A5A9PD87_9TELE|nr:AT-rich interactive domain-containing protein 5A [Triplophysa tibetana]